MEILFFCVVNYIFFHTSYKHTYKQPKIRQPWGKNHFSTESTALTTIITNILFFYIKERNENYDENEMSAS